jgi:lauroyl/myristoyl acyltransferase
MYYLFRIAVIVAPRLPRWLHWLIAYIVGSIAWLVATKARKQARQNMLYVCGPQMLNSGAERRRLRRSVQAKFRYNVMNYLALFSVPARRPEQILSDITVDGAEHLQAALARGKGVVIFSAHMGPFDYIMQWMAIKGYDTTIPVEHLKNQRVLDLITQLRGKNGLHILPLGGSAPMRALLQRLRANKIVLLTADRAIEGKSRELPFFGALARMPVGVAQLVQRTGATPLGAFSWYAPDGTIHGHFLPLAQEQYEQEGDLQRAILALLEQEISKHAEQWMAFGQIWTEQPSATYKPQVMMDS